LFLKDATAPVKAAPLKRSPSASALACFAVALPAPTEKEKTQLYFQRYVPHLPAAGEIVIFDRSWYNRAGVERVMGFCTPEQVEKFLDGAPVMEKAMVDAGIILLKYWLEVTPKEQERRLRDRINDGRKIWKLSPMDIKSFNLWDEYTSRATPCLKRQIPPGRRGLWHVQKIKNACV
jgi:polyphosphate kinase 2 (PPK2 family)